MKNSCIHMVQSRFSISTMHNIFIIPFIEHVWSFPYRKGNDHGLIRAKGWGKPCGNSDHMEDTSQFLQTRSRPSKQGTHRWKHQPQGLFPHNHAHCHVCEPMLICFLFVMKRSMLSWCTIDTGVREMFLY